MEDKREKRSGCTMFAIIGFALVLLPLVYVLSIGPASRLYETDYLSSHAYFWFYHPIVGAELKPDWAAQVIENYIALWNPPPPA